MVWRSRRVGAKVRVTASVKLLPVPSARIPCFINVHQHNKRCREVGFWVFAERRCWPRAMELECFCEFLLYVPGVAYVPNHRRFLDDDSEFPPYWTRPDEERN